MAEPTDVPDPDDAVPLPASGHFAKIAEVRHYLRRELGPELARHARVQRDDMNEFTYTAIAWEAIQHRLGPKFRVEIDRPIPGTNCRADIVMYRNLTTGVIAIEIKANAHATPLVEDLRKLREYIDRHERVNFGLVLYFSSVEESGALAKALRKIKDRDPAMGRRLAVVRVPVPRRRISWGDDEA